MPTGYEVKMYADIARIAGALERIARAIEAQPTKRASGYRPDNLLGNVIEVLADRLDKSPEHVADMIAAKYGTGDFDLAEDRLWNFFGPMIDSLEHELGEHAS